MSILSENVIPSQYGKIFETDASGELETEVVIKAILAVPGVKDAFISSSGYPKQITVHTFEAVDIAIIQEKVNAAGFHVLPKGMFPL